MTMPSTMQWLRAASVRIHLGSSRLLRHRIGRGAEGLKARKDGIAGWLGSSTGLAWLAKLALLLAAAGILRKIVVKVGGGIYGRIESGAWSWMLWAATAVWIIAAYRAGHPDWKPKERPSPDANAEQAEGDSAEAATGPDPQPSGQPPVFPAELVATVRDIGTPHAQLVPIAEHLRVSTDAVRAAAAAIGWPVKDVRQDGRSSSAGLRWDERPSPEQDDPLSGVVGAGQAADDNDDDSGEGKPRKGVRVKPIGLVGQSLFAPGTDDQAEKRAS